MRDKLKEAIIDMRHKGYAYKTIGKTVGLSPNTVKSFCRRSDVKVVTYANGANSNACKNCGMPLKHSHGKKKRIYCSDKCRSDWWNRNRRWTSHRKVLCLTCQHCGTEFKSSKNKQQKFCGRDCYSRSRYGGGLP